MFDHQCNYNAVVIPTDGIEIIIRAVEDVKSFEDLRISYISCLSENTQKRQKELMEKYYFECQCPKCLDVEDDGLKSSLICEKCSGCVPISSLICTNCNLTFENSTKITKFKQLKQKLGHALERGDQVEIIALYPKAISLLHAYDRDLCECLNVMLENDFIENPESALKARKNVLVNYEKNGMTYSPAYGDVEKNCAHLCLVLKKVEEGKVHARKAEEIFSLIRREGHLDILQSKKLISQLCNL